MKPNTSPAAAVPAAAARTGVTPGAVALSCAALLLLAYHLRYLLFVMLFVVQGFMLARAAAETGSLRSLLLAKAAATYAVLLPTLALGVLLDGSGARWLNASGLYTAYPDFAVLSLEAATLLGNLVMVQPFVVPTFGTNGVLWVLAFEWWYSCLYLLLLAQWRRRRRVGLTLLGLVTAAALAGFPGQFVAWGLIWLAGAAVASSRAPHVKLWLAIPLCAITLVLSRVMESHDHLLLAGHGLAYEALKNGLFAAGFAALLLALPRRPLDLGPTFSSALFFGHFPLMMFVVGASAAWQPLKQQADGARLLWFVLVALLIYALGWMLYAGLRRALRRRKVAA